MMCVCWGEGGGSTPQRHQTWMEKPVSVKRFDMMWGERFHTAATSDLDGGASL